MKIYEYIQGDKTVLHSERNDKYFGKFLKEIEVKPTNKDFNKQKDSLSIGDVVYVNKYNSRNKLIGFRAEIISFKKDNRNIKDKLNDCTSLQELDSLRKEIVIDKNNFIENQKLFIKIKNKIKNHLI